MASLPAQVRWFKASVMAFGASEKLLESIATLYLYGKPLICVSNWGLLAEPLGESHKIHPKVLGGHLSLNWCMSA